MQLVARHLYVAHLDVELVEPRGRGREANSVGAIAVIDHPAAAAGDGQQSDGRVEVQRADELRRDVERLQVAFERKG